MSPEIAGIFGIGLLLFMFLLRTPVAFAMGLVGFIGFAYLSGVDPALALLSQDIFETFSSYPLSVIPMFILMGSFAFASGISERLFQTTYTWVGALRGGLTIATVLACSGFAAICGSTAATAATMGKIALPEMRKYKYDVTLATGTVAAAGTLESSSRPARSLLSMVSSWRNPSGSSLSPGSFLGSFSHSCLLESWPSCASGTPP